MLSLKDTPCHLHWLRAYYITGDEAHGSSIFAKITQAEQDGKRPSPHQREKLYDFIDIHDLARMIVLAKRPGQGGRHYQRLHRQTYVPGRPGGAVFAG